MAGSTLPDPPAQLKAIQTYIKVSSDVERINPVVTYWMRLHSTETALSIDKDSPESKAFLLAIITWLEKFKQTNKDNEAVHNKTVGLAHYENFVLTLFNKVDTLDRSGVANKNTVRMFYMAAILFEAMAVFGPLNDEMKQKAHYAKFKAAYIQKCLQTGQVPIPGPIEGSDLENSTSEGDGGANNSNQTSQTPKDDVKPSNPESSILTPSLAPASNRPTTPKQPADSWGLPDTPKTPSLRAPEPKGTPSASPYAAPSSTCTSEATNDTTSKPKLHASNGVPLSATDLIESQKYCKFANSALQFDDIPTAVKNLEKCLKLLKTGES